MERKIKFCDLQISDIMNNDGNNPFVNIWFWKVFLNIGLQLGYTSGVKLQWTQIWCILGGR